MINTVVAPIYLTMIRKTKKNKNISLNMNWYRNVHFIENNNIKIMFLNHITPQIEGLLFTGPVALEYNLYWSRLSDLDNWSSVVTKFFQDALKDAGCIIDDNFHHIKKNTYEVVGQDKVNPRFEITISPYVPKNTTSHS